MCLWTLRVSSTCNESCIHTRRRPVKTVDEGSMSVVLDLPVERTTVMPALRGDVAAILRDLGDDHRYDVLLIVTELVSNVLDHTPGTGRLRILRHNAQCEITVEVDDGSPAQPVHGRSRLGGTRGRGIVVVDNPLRDGGKTAEGVRPRKITESQLNATTNAGVLSTPRPDIRQKAALCPVRPAGTNRRPLRLVRGPRPR